MRPQPQHALTFPGESYPKRQSPFVLRFDDLLFKADAVREVGPLGFVLLKYVAWTEDRKFYRAPPSFYVCDFARRLDTSENTFRKIREKCVGSGWLHWEAGTNRDSSLAWVTVPERHRVLFDEITFARTDPLKNCGNGGGIAAGNGGGTTSAPPTSSLLPTAATPPPPAPARPKAEEEVIEMIRKCGVDRAIDCVRAAIANGHTPETIRARVEHFLAHPGAWKAGGLFVSLKSPDTVGQPPSAGWPKMDPLARQRQASQARAASAEAERIEAAARAARRRDEEAARAAALRQNAPQGHFDFEAAVKLYETPALVELIKDAPESVRSLLVRQGPTAAFVRPYLMEALRRLHTPETN